MAEPTVCRTPHKSIEPKKISAQDKRKWEKHRNSKDKSTATPRMKK